MKQLIPFLMLILMLGVLVGADIYLARRFAYYFGLENARPLYFVFGAIILFMMVGMGAFMNTATPLGTIVFQIASITIGFMLYLLLSVILVDLFSLVLKTQALYYGIAVLVLSISVSSIGIWNAFNVRQTEQQITIKGMQKDIKAMHLTDIHIGHFRGKEFLTNIVARTNDANVDVVFVTGDLFDGKVALSEENMEPLKYLHAPVYFIEGNHDNYTGVQKIKSTLKGFGINVLENEIADFNGIQIIGLNHMLADHESANMHAVANGKTVQSVLDSLPLDTNKPSILLHHGPDGIKYAAQNGIDLYLAGHTHAGQLFPINIFANMMFEVNRGLHDFNGTKVFVSEGVGTFGPPMRIGTKSEMVVLNLVGS
jgi:predicted MPP superfamily phosphohydrolase